MSLKNKYLDIKYNYMDYLVLIKSGIFYRAYYDDARILSNIMDYQVIDNRCGFPQTSLDKVIDKLNEVHINYYVIDGTKKKFINNKYNKYKDIIKNQKNNDEEINKLLLELKNKMYKDSNFINKVKDLINNGK